MNNKRILAILIIPLLCLIVLTTCRPAVYLERVYKVYGKVTVANSEPAQALGSVEVSVGNYYYSELTNYYGDYEMELPEGTWTIRFFKEGYEETSEEISVGRLEPRVELNAGLVWIAPPFEMNGYWTVVLYNGDEEQPGPLFYFKQSPDGTIDGFGSGASFSGTVEDSVVTLNINMGGMLITLTGTVEPDGSVLFNPADPISDMAHFVPLELEDSFGYMSLSGPVTIPDDRGLAFKYPDKPKYELVMDLPPALLEARLSFSNYEGFLPGETYALGEQEDTYADVRLPYPDPGQEVESGSLTIGSDGNSGSFELNFPDDGDFLNGSFSADPPDYTTAAVIIDSAQWNGVSIPAGSDAGLYYEKLASTAFGGIKLTYLDQDQEISLDLEPHDSPISAGTYPVQDEMYVLLSVSRDDGSWNEYEPSAGNLTIDQLVEDSWISGTFSLEFDSGTESGSFDLPLITDISWE